RACLPERFRGLREDASMTQHRWLACQKLEAFQIERLEGLTLPAAQPPPAVDLKNQEQVEAGCASVFFVLD
ncbi:MAG: hypothetical protein RIU71_2354, partial [Pseudomonadota bacterium]